MKMSEFPPYEADDAPTTPSLNRVARKLYDASDSDSDDSDRYEEMRVATFASTLLTKPQNSSKALTLQP